MGCSLAHFIHLYRIHALMLALYSLQRSEAVAPIVDNVINVAPTLCSPQHAVSNAPVPAPLPQPLEGSAEHPGALASPHSIEP